MDHDLEVSLNLDSAMGVDFERSEDVIVSSSDISLDTSHEADIPMEFEQIEEQPILMDTVNEEVIVPEFLGDQFTMHEYTMTGEHSLGTTTIDESNPHLISQSDSLINFQVDSLSSASSDQPIHIQSKLLEVKPVFPTVRIANNKKCDTMVVTTTPRQVAIAPKPLTKAGMKTLFANKPFAIAPKPTTGITSKTTNLKKVSLAEVFQGNIKGNTGINQVGKQIIMVPAGSTQKVKVLTASSNIPTVQYIRANNSEQAKVISTKNVTGHQPSKPLMAKLIVQNAANQPAVITKLLPASSASVTSLTTSSTQRLITVQSKSVPISLSNKIFVASPTKQTVNIGKGQEMVTLTPNAPVLVTSTGQGGTTKKVVIKTAPKQNIMVKTGSSGGVAKTLQMVKESNVINLQGQNSQIHQVNIPGKGVQYFRLISNSTSAAKQPTPKSQSQAVTIPNKTFVLTDTKGNLIQMTAEKVVGHPPPLVVAAKATPKVGVKQKLVRIAPVTSSPQSKLYTSTITRSAQSILAPLSPNVEKRIAPEKVHDAVAKDATSVAETESLGPVLTDSLGQHLDMHLHNYNTHEVEVEFDKKNSSDLEESGSSLEQDSSMQYEEHPLIVIPSDVTASQENHSMQEDSQKSARDLVDIEIENMNSFIEPRMSEQAESNVVSGLRPRKACNCTKSQCLKLYCECFANGEFCHGCNCTNCFNNLENEELRQKAIRGCLDRNPHAFRPKIGKAKLGGPDIIRRHNKGCNCKRSGCLKNYCECYEAKIACTSICKCIGCRNVEDTVERSRRRAPLPPRPVDDSSSPPSTPLKQPCSFLTNEVIEAVCQCLIAAAVETENDTAAESGVAEGAAPPAGDPDPVRNVLEEFARCLQDVINASQHRSLKLLDENS